MLLQIDVTYTHACSCIQLQEIHDLRAKRLARVSQKSVAETVNTPDRGEARKSTDATAAKQAQDQAVEGVAQKTATTIKERPANAPQNNTKSVESVRSQDQHSARNTQAQDKADEGARAASSATLVRGKTNGPRSTNTTAKAACLPRKKIQAVFICSACGKSFDTRKGLNVHLAMHCGKKSSIPTARAKFKITPGPIERRNRVDVKTKSKRQRELKVAEDVLILENVIKRQQVQFREQVRALHVYHEEFSKSS